MQPANPVRATRERLGLSRKELAEKLGVHPRTVEGWEQGRRQPAGPILRLLEILAR